MFDGGFFVGLHMPAHAKHFQRCCISVNTLRRRKGDFEVNDWMMDSGAFTELNLHGGYRFSTDEYADRIRRWSCCGNLMCAVSQDYMCEPFMLKRTGLTTQEHQRLTIERYDALAATKPPVHLMPVLQGYEPHEYVEHLKQYGDRLTRGMWVGVGSVCKRNANVSTVEGVLRAIKSRRRDLRLHGFGLKLTALGSTAVREMLWSADSMAWSFACRREGDGPGANKWENAMKYVKKVEALTNTRKVQRTMFEFSDATTAAKD